MLKRDVVRDDERDFGAGAGAAPHLEPRANPLGALPHPRESPMPGASRAQHVLIDAAAVVSHQHAQVAAGVFELHFDVSGLGMPIGVDHGLAPDAMHIVSNQRRFESLIAAPAFRRLGGLKGDRLTRVPRGWAKDHPAADYLMHKQFLGFREEAAAFAARPDFYRQLTATLKALSPLVAFLNEPLLERLQVDRRAHILSA